MTGNVIYLAQRATRPERLNQTLKPLVNESSRERVERLVLEAAAHWTPQAILQRAHAGRQPGTQARPAFLAATSQDDFMSNLSPEQRAFVGEVARDILRQWAAKKANPVGGGT